METYPCAQVPQDAILLSTVWFALTSGVWCAYCVASNMCMGMGAWMHDCMACVLTTVHSSPAIRHDVWHSHRCSISGWRSLGENWECNGHKWTIPSEDSSVRVKYCESVGLTNDCGGACSSQCIWLAHAVLRALICDRQHHGSGGCPLCQGSLWIYIRKHPMMQNRQFELAFHSSTSTDWRIGQEK